MYSERVQIFNLVNFISDSTRIKKNEKFLTNGQLLTNAKFWGSDLQGADDKLGQTLRTHLKL
jgi:hypothetical protein